MDTEARGETVRDHDRREDKTVDNRRRAFLRNSVYAAYATPLITALLVAEKSAAASNVGRCTPEWCSRPGNRNEGCCQ